MKYRELGKNGIKVSEVGFGLWTVSTGWWGKFTDEQAVAMIRKAFDLGVTLFDSADAYGDGRADLQLASALKDKRNRIVIETRFGYDFYNAPPRNGHQEGPQDVSPKFVKFACEEALKRLATDHIDIYQMHNPRLSTVLSDDLFALLEQLKTEGKIRCYGAALGPAIGWKDEGLAFLARSSTGMMQIIHNLFEQDPGRSFLDAARRNGNGFMVRVPHSSGLLEGKYSKDTTFEEDDHRSHRMKVNRDWLTYGLQKLEKVKFIYEGRDLTVGQAALKWLLAEPLIASPLPNIYNDEQLVEFTQAPDKADLSGSDIAKLAELYSRNFYVQQPAATA